MERADRTAAVPLRVTTACGGTEDAEFHAATVIPAQSRAIACGRQRDLFSPSGSFSRGEAT
jgi:hypothetical protein